MFLVPTKISSHLADSSRDLSASIGVTSQCLQPDALLMVKRLVHSLSSGLERNANGSSGYKGFLLLFRHATIKNPSVNDGSSGQHRSSAA